MGFFMAGGRFEKGHKTRLGQSNPNAGRKPDEFKRIMAELSSNEETIEYFRKVLGRADDSDEFLILQTGVQVPIKVDADTWLKFWKEAAAYGQGKPVQPLEHSGEIQDTKRMVLVFPEISA